MRRFEFDVVVTHIGHAGAAHHGTIAQHTNEQYCQHDAEQGAGKRHHQPESRVCIGGSDDDDNNKLMK